MGSISDVFGNIFELFTSFTGVGSTAGDDLLKAGSTAVESFEGIVSASIGA